MATWPCPFRRLAHENALHVASVERVAWQKTIFRNTNKEREYDNHMRKIVAILFISDLLKFMEEDTQKDIKSSAIRRKQAIAVTTSVAKPVPDSGRMTGNPHLTGRP